MVEISELILNLKTSEGLIRTEVKLCNVSHFKVTQFIHSTGKRHKSNFNISLSLTHTRARVSQTRCVKTTTPSNRSCNSDKCCPVIAILSEIIGLLFFMSSHILDRFMDLRPSPPVNTICVEIFYTTKQLVFLFP